MYYVKERILRYTRTLTFILAMSAISRFLNLFLVPSFGAQTGRSHVHFDLLSPLVISPGTRR